MRQQNRCPKCAHHKLLHLPETGHFGLFEMYVCRRCGYAESYARDVKAVARLPGVENLLGEVDPGPYR